MEGLVLHRDLAIKRPRGRNAVARHPMEKKWLLSLEETLAKSPLRQGGFVKSATHWAKNPGTQGKTAQTERKGSMGGKVCVHQVTIHRGKQLLDAWCGDGLKGRLGKVTNQWGGGRSHHAGNRGGATKKERRVTGVSVSEDSQYGLSQRGGKKIENNSLQKGLSAIAQTHMETHAASQS